MMNEIHIVFSGRRQAFDEFCYRNRISHRDKNWISVSSRDGLYRIRALRGAISTIHLAEDPLFIVQQVSDGFFAEMCYEIKALLQNGAKFADESQLRDLQWHAQIINEWENWIHQFD
jgi:hypothetical protein